MLVLPRCSVSLRTVKFLHLSLLILSLGRGTAGRSCYTVAGCLFALLPTGEVESCFYVLFITNALVTFLTGSTKHSAGSTLVTVCRKQSLMAGKVWHRLEAVVTKQL